MSRDVRRQTWRSSRLWAFGARAGTAAAFVAVVAALSLAQSPSQAYRGFPADLQAVSKTVSPAAPVPGGTANFSVTIRNNGSSNIGAGSTMTDTLPSGVVPGAPLPAGCSASGQTVTCSLPAMANGATHVVTFPVNVTAGHGVSLCNTASVTIAAGNTDRVPGNNSASVCFTTATTPAPNAVDDAYAVLAHTAIVVPATSGFLSNDTLNSGSVASVNSAGTTGVVTAAADGSFTYTAPVGVGGPFSDTFSYTLSGPGGSDTATVTLNITGPVVWYVDNDAAAGGNGTLVSPFTTLSPLNGPSGAGDPDSPGQSIFVFQGSAPYVESIELEPTQNLFGQAANLATELGLVQPPFTVPSLPTAGSPSLLAAPASSTVSLSDGNTLAGIDIDGPTGHSAVLGSGVTSGAFRDIAVCGDGTAITLDSASGSFTFSDVLIDGGSEAGVVVLGGDASLDFTNSFVGFGGVGAALSFSNHTGGLTIANSSAVDVTAGAGISFSDADGSYVFDGLVGVNGADAGIDIASDSGGTFTFADATVTTNDIGVDISDSPGTFTFTQLNAVGSHGIQIVRSGQLNVHGGHLAGTSGHGVSAEDASVVIDTVTMGTAGGAPGTSENGVQFTVTATNAVPRTLEVSDSTIGPGVVGHGVNIVSSSTSGPQTTAAVGATEISPGGVGIRSRDAGGTDVLSLSIDNNTIEPQATGVKAVDAKGASLSSTTVTSLVSNVVSGAMSGGGILFDCVTFDAPGQVDGGNTVIGTTTARVQGDGLRFDGPSGDLAFASLDIANNAGTGLYVDTKAKGTTFNLAIAGGTVDTTNGTALFLDPLTTAITLDRVASARSPETGVHFDEVYGYVTILDGSLTGADGTSFKVTGGNADLFYGGTIDNPVGRFVEVIGATGGLIELARPQPGAYRDFGSGILLESTAADLAIRGGGAPPVFSVELRNASGTVSIGPVDPIAGSSALHAHTNPAAGAAGVPAALPPRQHRGRVATREL